MDGPSQFPSPAPGRCLLCTFALFSGMAASPAEFSGYAVLTTDYVFRGVSNSDSHGAFQLGGDVAFDSGVYFGVWGSTVDISNGPGRQRDLEVNYYAGYGFDASNRWNVGANVVSYTFPGAAGEFDYDYTEYSLTSNYNDRVWIAYSYSPDLYHSGESAQNFELYSERQFGSVYTVGAGVGYYDVSNLTGSGYSYWQLGVTRPVSAVEVDLRFHDTSDWVPIVSTPERAEARIVLSARIKF